MSPWPGMAIQLAAAAIVFVLLAGAFYTGMMGGGDVKLAAALALVVFAASTRQISGADVARRRRADPRAFSPGTAPHAREGRPEIPYGVAIAFGGLAILSPTVS